MPAHIEKALTILLVKEVKFHMKAENLKRILETSYDFTVQAAFNVIDDWHYKYIDEANLKRFLRSVGHVATRKQLIGIIRRIDTDGDAKINLEEFGEGIRSQFALTSPFISKVKPCLPTSSFIQHDVDCSPRREQSIVTTPHKSKQKKQAKKIRPYSANKVSSYAVKRNEVLSSIYGVQHNQSESKHGSDCKSSNSKLNKSVTFSNRVKVREYQNSIINHHLNDSSYSTPSKVLYPASFATHNID